nr:uncharacterized protein LOC111103137 isoform X2 [Crassostrea virginica]XP_022291889.1 uncharacterized protein LOC111103137 isoform X2 [Crassostrea virginica]
MSNQVHVKKCSQCPECARYYCHRCDRALCPTCKHIHVTKLDTMHHYITLYRDKLRCRVKTERCLKHRKKFLKFCKECQLPFCYFCRKHKKHKHMKILPAYENRKTAFLNIRRIRLVEAQALLLSINTDIYNCNERISQLKVDMKKRSQKLRDLSDKYQKTVSSKLYALKIKPKATIQKHIINVQTFERRYENMLTKPVQFPFERRYENMFTKPVQFLRFIKQSQFPQIQNTPKVALQRTYFLKSGSFKVENIIDIICGNQEKVQRKCQARNEHLLKINYPQNYYGILTRVIDIDRCCHISCLAQDFVWVSDERNLILTNNYGVCLDRITNAVGLSGGIHTINRKLELLYIASDFTINKRALDGTSNTFVKRKDQIWKPMCIYCSKSTGEVFVVSKRSDSNECNITIYNETGAFIIQHTNTNYRNPIFITENTNKDVVVTDEERGAVMVSTRSGKHRFSYKGHPPDSNYTPRGICSDPLSHILVCNTVTVEMIDQDGQFLLNLLYDISQSFKPFSIYYDFARHIVLVGSDDEQCTISAYRYLDRNLGLTGEPEVDREKLTSPSYAEIKKYVDEFYDWLEDVPFDFDEDSNEECSNCSDDEKDTPSEDKYYIPLSTVSW